MQFDRYAQTVRKVKHAFHDFAFKHMGLREGGFPGAGGSHLQRIGLDPRVLESIRISFRAVCGSA